MSLLGGGSVVFIASTLRGAFSFVWPLEAALLFCAVSMSKIVCRMHTLGLFIKAPSYNKAIKYVPALRASTGRANARLL